MIVMAAPTLKSRAPRTEVLFRRRQKYQTREENGRRAIQRKRDEMTALTALIRLSLTRFPRLLLLSRGDAAFLF